jgi:competence protein ComEC
MTGAAQRADLRLVPAAVAAWVGAVAGTHLRVHHALMLAAVVVGLAVITLAVTHRAAFAVFAMAAVAGATAVTIAAVRAPANAVHGLASIAADHPEVTADVVATGDPQVQQARGPAAHFGSLVLVPVSMRRLTVGSRVVRLRVPVLVLAHGSGWVDLLPSQRLTVSGFLLPARPGDTVAFALSARGPPVDVRRASLVQRIAGRIRAGLRAAAAPLPRDERGLLPGLVDGDVSRLPDDVRKDFRTTGLTHLVAVSGSNCAIVAAAALGLARAMRLRLQGRALVAAVAITAFVVLARPSPSVLRAAVMGSLGLAALATGRVRAGVPALAAAVLALVLVEPSLATADGFVLSVLATAGLLLMAPGLATRFGQRLPRWLAESLAVAVAAQVMTTPYIAVRFGRVSLLSVPANLLAVPAVPPATILGVLAATVAPWCLPIARVLALIAYLPTVWLVWVARTGAGIPGASAPMPGWVAAIALTAAAGVLALVLVRRYRRGVERWQTWPSDNPLS